MNRVPMNRVPMNRFRFRRTVGLAVLTTAMVAGLSTPAAAETSPTSMELLEKCDSADYCVFHVQGSPQTFWSTTEQVGATANCTATNQTATITWSRSTTSSNSLGISLKLVVGATKAFMVGFKIAYQHEWTETKTDSDSTTITIPPGHLGKVYHARQMERVSGQYEMHFGKRFYGHYYWYLPFTMTSPKGDDNDSVTAKSTPLTSQERKAYCH